MSFQNYSVMKYANYLMISLVCFFALAGCLTASSKQVRFTCDDSLVPSDFEKQIAVIAQAHHFFPVTPATPETNDLIFYSHPKQGTKLAAVISRSHTPEIILGVSILRGPGTEDKLPPEVLDLFDAIVREVNTQFGKSCTLQQPE